MRHFQFTLFAEGPTDRALVAILEWLLRETHRPDTVGHEFLPKSELQAHMPMAEHIATVIQSFPCDVLFVHRDADRQPPEWRHKEIGEAVEQLKANGLTTPCVCVVPIRMTEAWLLMDEQAIRRAAGNPNGKQQLQIPKLKQLESIPDPKQLLHALLREASGKRGRRRDSFDVHWAASLVSESSTPSPLSANWMRLRAWSAMSKNFPGDEHFTSRRNARRQGIRALEHFNRKCSRSGAPKVHSSRSPGQRPGKNIDEATSPERAY
jgi:hypothetical protein